MADDIAALGIRIDTGDVAKAVDELDRLPTAGERATRAFKTLTTTAKEFAIGFGEGARQGWREYFDGASRSEQASKKAEKGIKDVTKAGKEQAGVLREAAGSIKTLVAGYISFQAVSGVIRSVIQNTVKAEQEQAQLEAVLRSTGEAAGFSQKRLNEMAEALAKSSTFSAGAITSAQTRLLSYTGIVGEQFPKALQATIDMSARMGMSLEQSAETVGRALDVPSQGLTALQRQGFRFTEQQKKVVEQLERTGKISEAQGVILGSLSSAYGGAAAAAKDTFGGAIAGLRSALQDLTTGKDGSFDGARDGVQSLTDTLSSSETRQAFAYMVEGIAKVIEALTNATTHFFRFEQFLGETVARWVNGSDSTIDRYSERIGELQVEITTMQSLLSGPKKSGLPLSQEEVDGLTTRLAAARKEMGALQGFRDQTAQQLAGGTPGPAGTPFTPDRKVTKPPVPGASDKDLKQMASARLAADLSEYQRQLKAYVGAYTIAERQVEAARSDSRLSEQEYFEAKTALVRLNEAAQVRALEQEKARLGQQKLTGADLIKQQTRIKDIEAEVQGIRAESASQIELLGAQQAASMRSVARSYEDASAAAKDYLDTITRQNQRELEGLGRGGRQREIDQRRNERDDQFLERRTGLDRQLRANEITREQYDTYMAIEREAHRKALAEDDRYWSEKLRLQQDWSLGASEAIQNYLDSSKDIYSQIEGAFTSAFKGMEDALVDFVSTGKLDFKSLATSIIADINRIIIKQQIMAPLIKSMTSGGSGGGWLGALFGGGRGGANLGTASGFDMSMFFAKGGVMTSPGLSAYSGQVVSKPTVFPFEKGIGLMGEAGPEAILPLKRGNDGKLGVDAGQGGGRGGPLIVQVTPPAGMSSETAYQYGRRIGEGIAVSTERNG